MTKLPVLLTQTVHMNTEEIVRCIGLLVNTQVLVSVTGKSGFDCEFVMNVKCTVHQQVHKLYIMFQYVRYIMFQFTHLH